MKNMPKTSNPSQKPKMFSSKSDVMLDKFNDHASVCSVRCYFVPFAAAVWFLWRFFGFQY